MFLISPEALEEDSYTLTELKLVKEKWKNPSGKVLPVMVIPTDYSKIDAYLRVVTVLHTQGNLAAEVAIQAARLLEGKEKEPIVNQISDQVLSARISAYRRLWELTELLPKWPRAEHVTFDHLFDLSKSLRDWYFKEGAGMYLSGAAYTSYAALQDTLTALLSEQPSGKIKDEHYKIVRELCSALRHPLSACSQRNDATVVCMVVSAAFICLDPLKTDLNSP